MIKRVEVEAPTGMFGYEDGWTGAFTRATAFGAWANGTRVVKIKSESGDSHKIGELATVLGSMREPHGERRVMYFLEWDASPKQAVACIAWKLERKPRDQEPSGRADVSRTTTGERHE